MSHTHPSNLNMATETDQNENQEVEDDELKQDIEEEESLFDRVIKFLNGFGFVLTVDSQNSNEIVLEKMIYILTRGNHLWQFNQATYQNNDGKRSEEVEKRMTAMMKIMSQLDRIENNKVRKQDIKNFVTMSCRSMIL